MCANIRQDGRGQKVRAFLARAETTTDFRRTHCIQWKFHNAMLPPVRQIGRGMRRTHHHERLGQFENTARSEPPIKGPRLVAAHQKAESDMRAEA